MTGRLAGKSAVVTAAAQGIGRATVERFVAEGAHVIALDINAEALADVARATGCAMRTIDLTDAGQIAAFAGEAHRVDVLFSCAGFVANGTILDCDEREWAFSNSLNVTAMYRLIRALLPRMLERGGGSIITMASVASSLRGVPNRFAYGVTKAAAIGLTKSIAADFVTRGIRCNAICPGPIVTPSLDDRLHATGDYAAAHAAFVARQPIGRLGQAVEVANLAVYLASDESSFTTGQVHIIDGGWSN